MTPEQEEEFFALALDYRGAASQHAKLFYQKLVECVDRFVQPEATPTFYVVTCGWDYEGSDVKAILPTRAEAEAVVEKYSDPEHFSYDIIHIEEWKVGEVTDRRWEAAPTPQNGRS
jgi:hypothetical protein